MIIEDKKKRRQMVEEGALKEDKHLFEFRWVPVETKVFYDY